MRRAWRGLSGVLGLLTGCNLVAVADYGAPVPAYGVPDTGWRQYDLSGVVVDAETGVVIPRIQVAFEGEAARTDVDGTWSLVAPFPCDDCTLTADDIDGDANGAYAHHEQEHPSDQVYAWDIRLELEPADQ